MSFEQPKFGLERPLATAEKERALGNLREFIKNSSLEMKKQGIPANEQGRVDTDQFRGVYPKPLLERHKQYVEEKKEIFRRAKISGIESRGLLPGQKERAIKEEEFGEIVEMLLMAALQKNLKENFIVLRSSEYDDIGNGVDTLILDKNTGDVACALDEIGRTEGVRYQEKIDRISTRNSRQGGASLDYGVSFKRTDTGKMELRKGRLDNIPLFYCAFSESLVKSALRQFSLSRESSSAEKELFASFLRFCREQTDQLKEERLRPKLRERLELFEQSMLK